MYLAGLGLLAFFVWMWSLRTYSLARRRGGALALALRRSRLVASWLGWTAAAIAALALIAAPPALGLDLPVSLLSFLWIVVLSVLLGLASSQSATTSA